MGDLLAEIDDNRCAVHGSIGVCVVADTVGSIGVFVVRVTVHRSA